HEEVRALLPDPLRAPPPRGQPLADSREIAEPWRADAGVLDEQHAVAALRERRHDLLMSLPVEIPVDRGEADDVLSAKDSSVGPHRAGAASSIAPTCSVTRSPARDGAGPKHCRRISSR